MDEIKVRITSTWDLVAFVVDAWRRGRKLKALKITVELKTDYEVTIAGFKKQSAEIGCGITPLPKMGGEE